MHVTVKIDICDWILENHLENHPYGCIVDSEKKAFYYLKLCYSPALVATRLDFSAKMEQFTTSKSS